MRLTLHALSAKDSSALVGALLSAGPGAGDADRIAELAGGNPLFAEQYVRLLLEGGHLAPSGAGPCGPSGLARPLPDTVHAVLAARLDTLPADQKAALCGAAVLGETFWCGAVAAVCDLDAAATRAALAGLVARELVRPAATSTLDGETEYLFWHALARDVAYGRLPRKARARQHRAAGRWLEEQTGERAGEFSEILAYHYERGLEYAVAAGDEELAATLRPAALRASCSRASGRCAWTWPPPSGCAPAAWSSQSRTRRSGRACCSTGRRRCGCAAATTMRRRRTVRRSRGTGRRARSGLPLWRCVIWSASSPGSVSRASTSRARPWTCSRMMGRRLRRRKCWGCTRWASASSMRDRQAVVEAADAAEEIAAVLGVPEPAMALSCRGLALLQLGDAGGFEDCERAIRAARDQGLGVERSTIELNFADLAFVRGGAQARLDVLRDGMEFTRAHGLESYVLSYEEAMAAARMSAGEWEWALAEVGAAPCGVRRERRALGCGRPGSSAGVLLTLQGAAEEALAVLALGAGQWSRERDRLDAELHVVRRGSGESGRGAA